MSSLFLIEHSVHSVVYSIRVSHDVTQRTMEHRVLRLRNEPPAECGDERGGTQHDIGQSAPLLSSVVPDVKTVGVRHLNVVNQYVESSGATGPKSGLPRPVRRESKRTAPDNIQRGHRTSTSLRYGDIHPLLDIGISRSNERGGVTCWRENESNSESHQ